MVTRRNFLKTAAAASTALAATDLIAQRAGAGDDQPAPPSIAALTSMKDSAAPITAAERAQRIEKARQLCAQNKLDAVLMGGGTSLVYFAGIQWWLSERFFCLALPAKGKPFFVCPSFERDRAMEQIAAGPLGGESSDLRTWEEHENPYTLVAQGLKERGFSAGRVGIEETMYFAYSDGVAKAAPALTLASATPVTAGCRMIKSANELELMQLANTVTLKAYEAAWKALADGMTQQDFARLVSLAHQKLGFDGGAGVQVGEYSALPHGSRARQVIKPGTILLIDGGCSVEGYKSDISRTFVLGKPGDKMKQVFEIVHRAQTAALAAARPGLPAENIDAVARKIISDAGYGPDYKYFSHRLGHGIGMDGHEWPYLVRGDKLPLAPGMTFSDEPGVYIRGEFGVRLEDCWQVTEGGGKMFTPQSPSLEQPFA